MAATTALEERFQLQAEWVPLSVHLCKELKQWYKRREITSVIRISFRNNYSPSYNVYANPTITMLIDVYMRM